MTGVFSHKIIKRNGFMIEQLECQLELLELYGWWRWDLSFYSFIEIKCQNNKLKTKLERIAEFLGSLNFYCIIHVNFLSTREFFQKSAFHEFLCLRDWCNLIWSHGFFVYMQKGHRSGKKEFLRTEIPLYTFFSGIFMTINLYMLYLDMQQRITALPHH